MNMPQPKEQSAPVVLTDEQSKAITDILLFLQDKNTNTMVLEGHSGTGKSFVTRHLVNSIHEHQELMRALNKDFQCYEIVLTATTHKAAKVLGDANGREAQTIHSFLGVGVRYNFKTGEEQLKPPTSFNPFEHEHKLIIIDEASYICPRMKSYIEKGLSKSKVLFVGDPYQLAPVKSKEPIVFHSDFKTCTLTDVQRQAKDNPIIAYADHMRHAVQTQVFSPIPYDDTHLIHLPFQEFAEVVKDTFKDPTINTDHKVLAYTNKQVIQYNSDIRSLFVNSDAPVPGERYVSNDTKVTQSGLVKVRNEEEVIIANVRTDKYRDIDTWVITTEDKRELHMPQCMKQYNAVLNFHKKNKEWVDFYNYKNHVADLRPGYASTVHKSQGSTYDTVYIDLDDIGKCRSPNDVARLLYVAITRASNKVIFTGVLPARYRGEI